MEKKNPNEILVNETSEIKKDKRLPINNCEGANAVKEKLKRYYQAKDKLVPLFDDPEQSINVCYIRLSLLRQERFREQKEKMVENEKSEEHKGEDRECINKSKYSLIYGNEQETIEIQDIWNDKQNKSNLRHISIYGETGSGKSVLLQRIAYLWAKNRMWNDQFQWLLYIPLRKIINSFNCNFDDSDEIKDKDTKDIEDQWTRIVNELHIPQWNTSDIKYIAHSMNGLLLLDGFDEIKDEIEKIAGLKQWLRHCTSNENYCIIMTSHPNAICSYLDSPRVLNVVGFQSQDIQNYVRAYFQNIQSDGKDDDHQLDLLIKKLNSNPTLKILSHTPLYLRLFCYLARQNKLPSPAGVMSLSKFCETLLKCYMKWNWIRSNRMNDKIDEEKMFTIFEMEMDYLSQVAWEGLKCGQAVISCEIQQRVLNMIKYKYPRKDISVISQWSRINSFGFLQGQELMDSLQPTNSVYFPHLIFQEWLAAYYLVNCLYESNETKEHEQVCSILVNQQLTPKYSEMIPFMAGILYGNIENKKDPSGSGLLYFWKLLHSSPPQAVPIHQVMLHMHCLDAHKVDINSSFLPRSLQTCHTALIHSFKPLLIDWIKVDKGKCDIYDVLLKQTLNRLLDNVMKLYLPNFQYLLHYSDIHLCIIDQIKVIQTQLSKIDNNQLLLYHLCLLGTARTAQYLLCPSQPYPLLLLCFCSHQVCKCRFFLKKIEITGCFSKNCITICLHYFVKIKYWTVKEQFETH
ncbi:NTPase [Reticulomyxa filosa]|uniref:NTPase n=1 Tax=Reticulomyxa filosa TaxID=46433 RepID=X6NQD8_RETFI|nr:NTPase [Reticulomyxa filosa]|eukprot:ETO27894.1 NTPase [Reticulomyxa filosa]